MNYSEISLYDRLRAGTNVITSDEYLKTFIEVSHIAADILANTLGPYAHTTVIDDGQFRYSTKDGWSIASRLRFSDPLANTLFEFIKTISYSLVSKVGDGTTTAIVAADKFIQQIFHDSTLQKYRQRDVINCLERVKSDVIEKLNTAEYLHRIDQNGDFSDIRRIAYTSTNGNDDVADQIQKIYQTTKNPNIYVDFGQDTETRSEVQMGYRFDCHPKMIENYINADTGEYIPGIGSLVVYVFNYNVTYREHRHFIEEILNHVDKLSQQKGERVTALLLAPYFDDVMAATISNTVTGDLHAKSFPCIMMAQFPMVNELQRAYVNDLMAILDIHAVDSAVVEAFARLRDPESFEEKSSTDFFKNTAESFGRFQSPEQLVADYGTMVNDVTIGKDFLLVNKYDTNANRYKLALQEIQKEYAEAFEAAAHHVSTIDRKFIDANMRKIRFIGKMGIIHVGGESELEKKCLKDSIDDAVLAAKSAYENGYVKGMNLATISALSNYKDIIKTSANVADRAMTLDIISHLENAFKQTTLEVIRNKYDKAVSLSDPILNETDTIDTKVSLNEIIETANRFNHGYNLVTERYETAGSLTVINSVSTDIEIMKSMISILGYVLTSNQMLGVSLGYNTEIARKVGLKAEYDKESAKEKARLDARPQGVTVDQSILPIVSMPPDTTNLPQYTEHLDYLSKTSSSPDNPVYKTTFGV